MGTKQFPGDLGQLVFLSGATNLPAGATTFGVTTAPFQAGAAWRVTFTVHIDWDAATALTSIDFQVQGGYDGVHFSPVILHKGTDDTGATTQTINVNAGGSSDATFWCEDLKGTIWDQLIVTPHGTSAASDDCTVSAVGW